MTLKQHVGVDRDPLPVLLDEILELLPRETRGTIDCGVDAEHKASRQFDSVLGLILGCWHSATVSIESADRQIFRVIVMDLTDRPFDGDLNFAHERMGHPRHGWNCHRVPA